MIKFVFFTLFLLAMIPTLSAQYERSYEFMHLDDELPDVYRMSPEDFNASRRDRYDKIRKDKWRDQFQDEINFALDYSLTKVKYVTNHEHEEYVHEMIDKLTNNDPRFKGITVYFDQELSTNAMVVGKHEIVLTCQMVSRMHSEADLAFLLGHELQHIRGDHVCTRWNTRMDIGRFGYNSKMRDLMKLYREGEFESDIRGFKDAQKAGYSDDGAFHILELILKGDLSFSDHMMSTLDFVEYNLHFPDGYFLEEITEKDYDKDDSDRNSTHPNNQKRFDALSGLVDSTRAPGADAVVSQEKFEKLRAACQFEVIRQCLIHKRINYALHDILWMKKRYPNNETLAELEAATWLIMAKLADKGEFDDAFDDAKGKGTLNTVEYWSYRLSEMDVLMSADAVIRKKLDDYPESDLIRECHESLLDVLSTSEHTKELRSGDEEEIESALKSTSALGRTLRKFYASEDFLSTITEKDALEKKEKEPFKLNKVALITPQFSTKKKNRYDLDQSVTLCTILQDRLTAGLPEVIDVSLLKEADIKMDKYHVSSDLEEMIETKSNYDKLDISGIYFDNHRIDTFAMETGADHLIYSYGTHTQLKRLNALEMGVVAILPILVIPRVVFKNSGNITFQVFDLHTRKLVMRRSYFYLGRPTKGRTKRKTKKFLKEVKEME